MRLNVGSIVALVVIVFLISVFVFVCGVLSGIVVDRLKVAKCPSAVPIAPASESTDSY